MPASTLFPGERVFEEKDLHELIGNGQYVEVNGEKRLLSRLPPPKGHDSSAYSIPFGASGIQLIDKSNLDAAIDDQVARLARVSDYIDFDPFDQDGLPTCWAIGTAQLVSITRRILGLPHKQMSGCSLAVPISGGHVGGYEGDSIKYAYDHGVCDTDVWPENQTRGISNSDPKVIASREKHRARAFIQVQNDQQWWSALLRTVAGVFAYNWMSHVMAMCDFVRIEAGRYGYRSRNSWGKWGSANRLGFMGFNVYPMGHGTPSSGFVLQDILPSET